MILASTCVFNRTLRRYDFPPMLLQNSNSFPWRSWRLGGYIFLDVLHKRFNRQDAKSAKKRGAFLLCALCVLCGEIAFSPRALADGDSNVIVQSSDGQYQLVLGNGWATHDFHLDAVQIGAIQKHRGEYAEVIIENQSDYTNSLAAYARAKRDTMAISLDNPKLTAGQYSQINGHDAISFEIHGQLPGTNTSVGYCLTVMKTKTHYVQVIGWTVESHFPDNVNELQALASGFSESANSGN
jgi:hypothetical protein